MFIAISLVLSLIIVILLYILKNLRLDFSERYLQSRHVVVTIIYAILGVIGFNLTLLVVNGILSINFIRLFLFTIVPGVNKAASFYWIVTLISNIVFLPLLIVIFKLINKFWIPKIPKNEYMDDLNTEDANMIDRFFHWISKCFYRGKRLKPLAENIGVWFRCMRIIFMFVLIVETLALTIFLGCKLTYVSEEILSTIVKNVYMIPMASYVVLNQIEIFLCADKSVASSAYTGKKKNRLIGDYKPLIELYRKFYGDTALISYYTKGEGDFTQSLSAELEYEQKKRAEKPELLEAIYRNLECCTTTKSAKYLDALVDMVNGKNVAVTDMLNGEFLAYLLSYLQNQLSQNKKVLVVCDTERQVEDVVSRYNEVFELINRVPYVWNVKRACEMHEGDAQILVCTEEELLGFDIRSKQPMFFESLANVVMINAYGFICRDKAFLRRLFNYIGVNGRQFAFFTNENNPDMKVMLEAYIDAEIEVYENYGETTNTCIMFWRGEGGFKTQNRLSANLLNDFGVAYTISLIASRYDVLDINVRAPETIPIYTYRDIVVDAYAKVLSNEFFQREDINIATNIRINGMLKLRDEELSFIVLHDTNNNLPSLLNVWLPYGGEKCTMVHMISRPYMLREYFAYCLQKEFGKLSTVKAFVPMKVLNTKAAMIAFLIKMRMGVTVEEIINFAYKNGIEETHVEKILEYMLDSVFEEGNKYTVYECFSFDKTERAEFINDRYIYTHRVRISSELLYDRLCAMTDDNACLVCNGTERIVLPINKKDIYNHWLFGQCCYINGERFKIDDIRNGEIIASVEETVIEDKEYTPVFEIKNVGRVVSRDSRVVAQRENYIVRFYAAEITRQINGYYESSMGLDFCDDRKLGYRTFEEPLSEKKKANYLELKLLGDFGEKPSGAAALLALSIRGVLETLLPNNYKDIMVLTDVDRDSVTDKVEKRILSLIPKVEDGAFCKNTSSEINIYIVDYSSAEVGALSAIAEDIDRMMIIIKDYLAWVAANPEIKRHYIHFGAGRMPGVFDASVLSTWLENSAPLIEYPEKILDGNFTIAATRYCALCGRAIFTSGIDIGGGRVMCEVCAKHGVKSTRKIERILRKAYTIIQNKYGVVLPPGISIEFASKETVAAISNTPPGYVTLGVYVLDQKKIYVVKDFPEKNIQATVIHELTHAWQHDETPWIFSKELKYAEGHSMYTEIKCMYSFDVDYAAQLENETRARTDEYGEGFRYWEEYLKTCGDDNIFMHITDIEDGEK